VPGAELLQRRADVTISYRETEIYDASRGAIRPVLEIVSVELVATQVKFWFQNKLNLVKGC
ncbi:MAG: hypothetical protein AAFY91_17065, partial [Bacteroidota bacterium]